MKKTQSENKLQIDTDFYNKDEVLIEDLLRVIYKGRFILIFCLILSVVMTFLYINSRPVVYKSSMKFLQNNRNIADYDRNILSIFNSDEFRKELSKDESLKKSFAEQHKKAVNDVSDDDIFGWISLSSVSLKSEDQEKSLVDGQYVPMLTSITVNAIGKDKELNTVLANTYYDVLKRLLERNQAKYNADKINFLHKKVDILREELNKVQLTNNKPQQGSSLTAYELALNELAEAKASDLNYKTAITQISKAKLPAGPEYISKKKYLIMGSGLGIFAGLFVAFVYDLMRNINWKSIKH
jgi:uncharacterized protein involved in exopolysaccharide biosynthesis